MGPRVDLDPNHEADSKVIEVTNAANLGCEDSPRGA